MQTALSWLSTDGRAVIGSLASSNGVVPGADRLATQLGLGNRYRLARMLRREGLPPLAQLTDWIRLLGFLLNADTDGTALLQIAHRAGFDAAACYRLVKRTLGVPWSEARDRGFTWALIRFLADCRRPSRRSRQGATPACGAAAPRRAGVTAPNILHALPRPSLTLTAPPSRARRPDGQVAATLRLGEYPFDVAVSPQGAVYVTRVFAATVERLDLASRRFVASVPVGSAPSRVVFDAAGRRAYVTNQFSDSISVIDVATNRQVDDIPVSGDPGPVALAPGQGTLYVTTNRDTLYGIDLATKCVIASLPLPATSHHLFFHPNGRRLYVATRLGGTVIEWDVQARAPLRTFSIGGKTQALAFAPDGSELYVANEFDGLDVVDVRTGAVVASVALAGRPFGMALTPDGAHLYVGLLSAERVQVVDRTTLRVVKTIPTGGVPREIAFAGSGTTALIANEAGWVTVVT